MSLRTFCATSSEAPRETIAAAATGVSVWSLICCSSSAKSARHAVTTLLSWSWCLIREPDQSAWQHSASENTQMKHGWVTSASAWTLNSHRLILKTSVARAHRCAEPDSSGALLICPNIGQKSFYSKHCHASLMLWMSKRGWGPLGVSSVISALEHLASI